MTELKQIPLPTRWQYFCSSDGQVYRWTGSEMKPVKGWEEYNQLPQRKLYHRVHLVMLDGPRKFYVHRLMLITFNGEEQDLDIARHLNDDSLNNVLYNLSWGTHLHNNGEDRKANGTDKNRGKNSITKQPEPAPEELADMPF